jgi:hypothetical protein
VQIVTHSLNGSPAGKPIPPSQRESPFPVAFYLSGCPRKLHTKLRLSSLSLGLSIEHFLRFGGEAARWATSPSVDAFYFVMASLK